MSKKTNDPLAAGLIAEMFSDDLAMAERMVSIGNIAMARAQLKRAAEKLDQLEPLFEEVQPPKAIDI